MTMILPSYILRRSRRAKRLSIAVRCDAVTITAPIRTSDFLIQSFLTRHAAWIEKTRAKIQKRKTAWRMPEGVTNDSFSACKKQARAFILERLEHYAYLYGLSYCRVTVKNMRSRWGSCSRRKNLNFHYRLLFLPVRLADYVIVHELCHLKHLNHSKRFWDLVRCAVPDHTTLRRELGRYGL